MSKYPIPNKTDYGQYELPEDRLEAKHGLPKEVKFCKKCIISNQRPISAREFTQKKDMKKPTINFDENGICDACAFAEQKKNINWEEREKELWELCDRNRKSDGSYDCIVSGSGGKDSFYTSHLLKYKYKMHPLTVTWAPHIYTQWGWENFQAWIHAGFDNYLHTPNGRIHRLLTRLALENIFYPFHPFTLGQKAEAPKLSCKLNIPLVFYGENEAEYGNPVADNDLAKREWSYFAEEDLSKILISGVSIAEYEESFGLCKNDLLPYLPANPHDLHEAKTEVQYFGYYEKWHPQSCYYYAVEKGGFRPCPERNPGTYSKYNSIDDKVDDFYFYTYFVKFGIGRATYDASQEIRSGDITREEGVALVKRFDGEYPERFADEIFRYLCIPKEEFPIAYKMFEQPIIDRDYFKSLEDQFRSPHLWRAEKGIWKLRKAVWH